MAHTAVQGGSRTRETADAIRKATAGRGRVTMTELTRGKDWRSRLPEHDVLEIVDHNETAGWLVSSTGMEALLDMIESLEAELDRTRAALLFSAREPKEPENGQELAMDATRSLTARIERMREAVDGR